MARLSRTWSPTCAAVRPSPSTIRTDPDSASRVKAPGQMSNQDDRGLVAILVGASARRHPLLMTSCPAKYSPPLSVPCGASCRGKTIEEAWPSDGALDSVSCGVESFRPVAGFSRLSSPSLCRGKTIEEAWPSDGALDSVSCGVESFRPVAGFSRLSPPSLLQAMAATTNTRTLKAAINASLGFNSVLLGASGRARCHPHILERRWTVPESSQTCPANEDCEACRRPRQVHNPRTFQTASLPATGRRAVGYRDQARSGAGTHPRSCRQSGPTPANRSSPRALMSMLDSPCSTSSLTALPVAGEMPNPCADAVTTT